MLYISGKKYTASSKNVYLNRKAYEKTSRLKDFTPIFLSLAMLRVRN